MDEVIKDFNLLSIDVSQQSLHAIFKENKFTIIEYWFKNCAPCRDRNKVLRKIHKKYGGKGLAIVNIYVSRSKDNWQVASKEDKIVWSNLYAGKGHPLLLYGKVSYCPHTVLVDQNGLVIADNIKDIEGMMKYIKQQLKEK